MYAPPNCFGPEHVYDLMEARVALAGSLRGLSYKRLYFDYLLGSGSLSELFIASIKSHIRLPDAEKTADTGFGRPRLVLFDLTR